MDKYQFRKLLDKYLEGKCSPKEEQLLVEFYEYFQKDEEWDTSGLGDLDKLEHEILGKIESKVDKIENGSGVGETPGLWRYLKIAATLLLLVVSGYLAHYHFYQQESLTSELSELITRRSQKSSLILSDGTRVTLNSGSKLSFPENFKNDIREVRLEGEAFFEVKHDPQRPFVVKAGDLATTVLGTTFNILAYPENDEVQVTVATGKVQVAKSASEQQGAPFMEGGSSPERTLAPAASAVVLTGSEQATYYRSLDSLLVRTVDLTSYLAWKEGILYFDEKRFEEVVAMLEMWYDVDITLENEKLGDCVIMGEYKDEKLGNIFKALQFSMGITIDYRSMDEEIIIRGEQCTN